MEVRGGEFKSGDKTRFGGRFERYKTPFPETPSQRPDGGVGRTGGTWASKYGKKIIAWDNAPTEEYFKELFRVSKNQIIWGGNYFSLPPTRCFVVWDKRNISEKFTMAMCEYAWTSFFANAKIVRMIPQGTKADPRFHPTQKPVGVYEWLLDMYAKPGDKILDTHCGSASSLVACENKGFKYVGFEIDPGYYEKAKERLNKVKDEITLFNFQDRRLNETNRQETAESD